VAIHLPFKNLSQWQQIAFSCALLERMLPNYQMFSEAVEFGEYKVLRNQLDLVWQWLDKKSSCKINYQAQLLKLEPQVPDPDEFDFFGVFPALDVCMGIMSLLQGLEDKESDSLLSIPQLSENSVSAYVELELIEQLAEGNMADNDEDIQNEIQDHPLMQWEVATQIELCDFLSSAPENKQTCIEAKAMVLEEGLSNLGIELK